MVSYAMTVRNLTRDQHKLLQFKHRIIDPRNILANNWTTTAFFCNWVGVSCSAKHRRVTALNLSNMDLTGNVPPHLGNLSFLVSLNLCQQFSRKLQRSIGNLTRLKEIDLWHSALEGEIPREIGNLVSSGNIFCRRFEEACWSNPSFHL
ncbi:hypothetical protein PTKIN_Ptkin16aG0087200 [Pterospermum kingtungense]